MRSRITFFILNFLLTFSTVGFKIDPLQKCFIFTVATFGLWNIFYINKQIRQVVNSFSRFTEIIVRRHISNFNLRFNNSLTTTSSCCRVHTRSTVSQRPNVTLVSWRSANPRYLRMTRTLCSLKDQLQTKRCKMSWWNWWAAYDCCSGVFRTGMIYNCLNVS